jgi:membrane protease YdiL (CAAX protease family)
MAGGLLLGIGVVAGAWRGGRGSLIELGIHRTGLLRSLCGGLLLGLVMGLPSALYLWRPDLAPIPVREDAIGALAPIAFLTLLFGQTLFATAVAEELAFRGLLQAFGVLRERSGNLAGCIVAHWVVDALLLAGLYAA